MNYKLLFKVEAEKEWSKLDFTIKRQFKNKLVECLKNPYTPSVRLNGMKNCYKNGGFVLLQYKSAHALV
ncbi:mRNA interferase RelE [Oligella ureolytica]|uniref:Plasmid stabilization protein n=1 Tax=Oligella ureolytica TaxID=90244 RepID=A0A378XDU1_9BURK|nr:hypothetical protein [Oligella ureolytica]QPT40425.1 plasmid stabilization protein [Oligella ureolytica]SUA51064.1 mRNA interferase RelE [Oligella ureolytica]